MADDDRTDETTQPDATTAVAALTAKYGDAQRAAERLWEINDRLTRKVARLEQRPELPEGGRLLTKEEAAAFDAYAALGKPDELRTTVEKVPTLEAEIATRDKRERLGKAARLLSADEGAGRHLEKYLPDLADRLEFREVTEGDTKAEAAFYKPEQGESRPLAKYLEEEHPLVWKGLQRDGGERERRETAPAPTYPRQQAEGKPPRTERTPDDVRKSVEGTANYTL